MPVLESYEAVRRQILYMNKLDIPDDFEVILVDDGSRPPIMGQNFVELPKPEFNFKYGYRADFRPFTKACAVNEGVRQAEGEWIWLLMIDFMATKPMMNFISNYELDLMICPTIRYALLDENGKLEVVGKRRTWGSVGLSAFKKEEFIELGGYNEKFVGFYPSGDDVEFGQRYFKKRGQGQFVFGPTIYGFPKDNEVDVCPAAMEDSACTAPRPDIFYGSEFRNWKLNETKIYWEQYYDDNIKHPEKGFRRVKCPQID